MSTREPERAVRELAQQLQTALIEARAAGLRVTWPSTPDGLSALVINETKEARAVDTSDVAPKRVIPDRVVETGVAAGGLPKPATEVSSLEAARPASEVQADIAQAPSPRRPAKT